MSIEVNGIAHTMLTAGDFDRSCQDVDLVHDKVLVMDATVVHGPQEDDWAPGYYSALFEDPDGVRLEINHVPGKGLLG